MASYDDCDKKADHKHVTVDRGYQVLFSVEDINRNRQTPSLLQNVINHWWCLQRQDYGKDLKKQRYFEQKISNVYIQCRF